MYVFKDNYNIIKLLKEQGDSTNVRLPEHLHSIYLFMVYLRTPYIVQIKWMVSNDRMIRDQSIRKDMKGIVCGLTEVLEFAWRA
jgi:hypothetical protein